MFLKNPHILHICAIIMLVMALLAPVTGVCHEGERGSAPEVTTLSIAHDQTGTPCCPDSEHNDDNYCGHCSTCPCHAPLPPTTIQLSIITSTLKITFSEPTLYFPKVYLSLFDPPDVTA